MCCKIYIVLHGVCARKVPAKRAAACLTRHAIDIPKQCEKLLFPSCLSRVSRALSLCLQILIRILQLINFISDDLSGYIVD
jgi:hypothetical protein